MGQPRDAHFTESCDEDTPHLILNVETTRATLTIDAMTEVIHASLGAKGLTPSEHFVDGGIVVTDSILSSQVKHGIMVFGPVRENVSWQARTEGAFDVTQFLVDWTAKRATCPQGNQSVFWRERVTATGRAHIEARFGKLTCKTCPVRSCCTRGKTSPRGILLRPQAQHEMLLAARAREADPAWWAAYAIRSGVEGTISQGVRSLGVRRSRYRGLEKTDVQHVITAVAINVERVIDWFEGVPRAGTKPSRFAALKMVA